MSVGFILILFGFVFGGISTAFILTEGLVAIATGKLIFLLIFSIIGLAMITGGIVQIIKVKKEKNLAKTGKITIGTFISSKGGVQINGVDYNCITFEYKDDNGIKHKKTTRYKYTNEEVSYFGQLKNFEIKYNNKNAVIVKEIDTSYVNYINNQAYEQGHIHKNGHRTIYATTIYVCPYCNNSQNEEGKCENCGAQTNAKKKIIK